MVELAQAEGANMRTVEMNTGHSPWLVDAQAVVGHLLYAVHTGMLCVGLVYNVIYATPFIVKPLEDVTSPFSTTNVDVPV